MNTTASSHQGQSQITPPPLPGPGTGGHEELPTTDTRAPGAPEATTSCGGSSEVRRFVLTMIFLVGVWALSGGGHFWPAWVFLGWGMKLLATGAGAGHRRATGGAG